MEPQKQDTDKKIEEVQKRATKLIPGFYNLSYQERLQRLKLPTLAYRRAHGDMIEVYKMLAENGGIWSNTAMLIYQNQENK